MSISYSKAIQQWLEALEEMKEARQYLLRKWDEARRCDIREADRRCAGPGAQGVDSPCLISIRAASHDPPVWVVPHFKGYKAQASFAKIMALFQPKDEAT